MSLIANAEPISQKGFERGIDRESPRTMVKPGGYEDAQNILLSSPQDGGRHVVSMQLDTKLDPLIAWPAGNPIWCAPFTYPTYNAKTQVLTYSTHLLILRDSGQYHRYDPPTVLGTAGTSVNIRRGITGSNLQVNHWIFDKWLCLGDARNAPMKYGQHFLWKKQLEPTPYLFPLGTRPVSPLIPGSVGGESWTHAGGLNQFVGDAQVPFGARVGAGALYAVTQATGVNSSKLTFNFSQQTVVSTTSFAPNLGAKTFTVAAGLTIAANAPLTVTTPLDPSVSQTGIVTSYSGTSLAVNLTAGTNRTDVAYASWNILIAGSLDFTAPPQPYGGANFVSTDFLSCSFISATTTRVTGSIAIRFEQDATNYFQFNMSPFVDNTAWTTVTQLISAAVTTGAPSWTTIFSVRILNNDSSTPVFVDDLYFLYANAPPALGMACSHRNRIVGGGAPVAANPGEPTLSTLYYSDAGNPDNFPSANSQNMSGGFESLARTNAINAVREYLDTVIVGCPQAIFSWTIGDTGAPVKSTLSTEHGIDSHRGIVETPSGSLLFPWQRGLYLLRPTGRQYTSAKIEPLLQDAASGGVFTDAPQWWMSVVDERTKTIRISWRQMVNGGDPGFNNQGVVYDYVLSQALGEAVYSGRFTQQFDWATPAFVGGTRETLYTKAGSPDIWRLGATTAGALQSFVTLPWESLDRKVFLDHWVAAQIPYKANTPVDVYVRYASNPGEFDTAAFSKVDTLPANPDLTQESRVPLGGGARWAQLKIQAESIGYAVYPPVEMLALPTKREP